VQRVRVVNADRASVLGTCIALADRWWSRARGMLGRPPPAAGEGMLIRPCRAVHTLGMRYPLDVAFLDRDGRVVEVYPALPPGAWSRWHRAAIQALELPAGTLGRSGTRPGDRLVIELVA